MLEELKEESIVNKVGGRFKLSTLMQKRLVALNNGARSLVDHTEGLNKMEIVLQEIIQNKIFLDTSNEVKITGDLNDGPNVLEINPVDV